MVGGKGPLGGGIDIMAYFLSGGGHGRNIIFPVPAPLAHHVLHYHFRHGRTADIAVADEKDMGLSSWFCIVMECLLSVLL